MTPTSWKRSLSGWDTGAACAATTTAPNRRTMGPLAATAGGACAPRGTGRVAAKILIPQKAALAATRAQMKKPVQRELMRGL